MHTAAASSSATPTSEAFAELVNLAERCGAEERVAQLLAARALRVTAGSDFPVARDACEALLRRLGSSREVVVRRTRGGYGAGTRGKPGSKYDLWLADAEALTGSCNCADFGKSALGLCKHLLALGARARAGAPRALRWDPVRPLTGAGDRLGRIWWDARVRLSPGLARLFQTAPLARPIEPEALLAARRIETLELLVAACRRAPLLAEPALGPILEAELGSARRGHPVPKRELDRLLRGLKRKLFPYQREGVARFLAAGRLLLADDMGLGKTAQAIASCHALFAAGRASRALVVVPASLKPQWLREWRMFTDVEIAMVDGNPEERMARYRRRAPGVLLANYEQLLRDLPEVQRFAPELVILDEAQRIKNWETRTAAVVKQLDPAWRLVLTGTPMENRLDELASIVEWVDEQALEPRWRLASWHTVRADGARETVGARNLETLRARLAPIMLRRLRENVLAQLPPRRDTIVPTGLTPAQQAAHDDLAQPIARIAASAQHRPLTRAEFLKLMTLLAQQRMICNGLALRDFATSWPLFAHSPRRTEALLDALGSPKLLDLRERLVELAVGQGRKVVVFSQWRRMLQLAHWVCADQLERAGVRAVFFTGQESQHRRSENLVSFHDDPGTRVLFASDAGGVGLNLQRAASCCINLELPWNPAVLEQRIGRVFRFGQTQPVEVYNYVSSGGIEERIAQLVGDKRALFKGLFDGTSDEIPFERGGSFLARVHALVRPEDAIAGGDHEDVMPPVVVEPEPEPEPEPAPAPAPPVAFPSSTLDATFDATLDATELVRALSALQVRPVEGGRVAFELPASAAATLGGLLRALATSLETPSATRHEAR